jgi:hypothetical protein
MDGREMAWLWCSMWLKDGELIWRLRAPDAGMGWEA